jgi:uncharacterized protein (DUF362 family)
MMSEPVLSVAASRIQGLYPSQPPFHPSASYPEYPFAERSSEPNGVYDAVRKNFLQLGWDREHANTPRWNPLGHLVTPGDKVFIKPNLVDDRHRFGGDAFCVITHPSVVRAVADYVAIALRGRGRLLIGDNPHVDAHFDRIREICHFGQLEEWYRSRFGLECRVLDLRHHHMPDLRYYGFKAGRVALPGDPQGFTELDLGGQSLFRGIPFFLFRGTYNDRFETFRFHAFRKHRYVFSNSILNADVFISIPKLKAHAKVGLTLNVKGLIGTIANKNCLVHWRIGFPKFGGDEYPNPERKRDYCKLLFQHLLSDFVPERVYFRLRNYFNERPLGRHYNHWIAIESQRKRMLRGSAETNDTTWRMTVDVYNAFVRDDTGYRKGRRRPFKALSVVDGVVGGDTDGPHFPHPVESRTILTGDDLLATDVVAARLADYDLRAIRYLQHLFDHNIGSYDRIRVVSEDFPPTRFWDPATRHLMFRPPHRWPHLSLHALEPGPSFLPL